MKNGFADYCENQNRMYGEACVSMHIIQASTWTDGYTIQSPTWSTFGNICMHNISSSYTARLYIIYVRPKIFDALNEV